MGPNPSGHTMTDGPTEATDLDRTDNGKVVEHWDTVDVIPPRHDWNNNNG